MHYYVRQVQEFLNNFIETGARSHKLEINENISVLMEVTSCADLLCISTETKGWQDRVKVCRVEFNLDRFFHTEMPNFKMVEFVTANGIRTKDDVCNDFEAIDYKIQSIQACNIIAQRIHEESDNMNKFLADYFERFEANEDAKAAKTKEAREKQLQKHQELANDYAKEHTLFNQKTAKKRVTELLKEIEEVEEGTDGTQKIQVLVEAFSIGRGHPVTNSFTLVKRNGRTIVYMNAILFEKKEDQISRLRFSEELENARITEVKTTRPF